MQQPIINENGLKLYPVGENQVYIFVSVFKDTPFINIRMVLHGGQLVTRDGVSLNNYELTKFREICPELQLAIREMNSRDFLLGNYKLVRYEADSKVLQFSKIRATQDHQEFEGPNVCLIGDEIPALFAKYLKKLNENFTKHGPKFVRKLQLGKISKIKLLLTLQPCQLCHHHPRNAKQHLLQLQLSANL